MSFSTARLGDNPMLRHAAIRAAATERGKEALFAPSTGHLCPPRSPSRLVHQLQPVPLGQSADRSARASSARAVLSRGIPTSSTPKIQTACRTPPDQTTAAGTAIPTQPKRPSYRARPSPASRHSRCHPPRPPRREVIPEAVSPPSSPAISTSLRFSGGMVYQTNTSTFTWAGTT